MLTWTQEGNGWVSNGYRIVLIEPYRWALLRAEPNSGPVQAEATPLAEARTLALCKREAEHLDAATRLGLIRRRLWGQLVLALTAFVFVPTMATPWDLVFFLAVLAVAAHAVGFLAGTYLARSHVAVRDLAHNTSAIADDRLCLWVTGYGARRRVGL